MDVSWHLKFAENTQTYYAKATMHHSKPSSIYLARIIMNAGEGEYVDHINFDTLDNRKSNLRILTNSENLYHRKDANRNARSGCRNVHWNNKKNCWTVQFWIDGRNHVFGKFKDLDEAIKYAENKRSKIYNIS